MKYIIFLFLLLSAISPIFSQLISISGRALDENVQGLQTCNISLLNNPSLKTSTNSTGNFTLTGNITSLGEQVNSTSHSWLKSGLIYINSPYDLQKVFIDIFDTKGHKYLPSYQSELGSGTSILNPGKIFELSSTQGVLILRVRLNNKSFTHIYSKNFSNTYSPSHTNNIPNNLENSEFEKNLTPNNSSNTEFSNPKLKRSGLFYDSLVVSCPNLLDKKLPLQTFTQNLGDITIKRPNILFVMTDQQRGDGVGADGSDWVTTPILDKIAEEGVLFSKAYASLPSCTPARTSVLSGMSPWGHGLLGYSGAGAKGELPFEMPKIFNQAGYYTIGIGKQHFGNKGDHGYDSLILEEAWRQVNKDDAANCCDYRFWFNAVFPDGDVDILKLSYTDHRGNKAWPYADSLHATYWTAQQSINFLNNYNQDKPWLLKLSFQRPHPPFDPPQRWLDHYKNINIPKPIVSQWGRTWHGTSVQPEPVSHTQGTFSEEGTLHSWQAYLGGLSFVDEQLGRVIQKLKEIGELENTLVLFVSDHGDMMGDHDLWRKTYAYEGSARVPMLMRWGENINMLNTAARGQKSNYLVELRDILPTFMALANIPQSPTTFKDQTLNMEGSNMLEIIKDNNASWRERLDLEHSQIYWPGNAWTGLTDGRYKYIYFTTSGRQQLFDLQNDPKEITDLSTDNSKASLLAQWRQYMVDHLSVRGSRWVNNGDLVKQSNSLLWRPNWGQ